LSKGDDGCDESWYNDEELFSRPVPPLSSRSLHRQGEVFAISTPLKPPLAQGGTVVAMDCGASPGGGSSKCAGPPSSCARFVWEKPLPGRGLLRSLWRSLPTDTQDVAQSGEPYRQIIMLDKGLTRSEPRLSHKLRLHCQLME